MKLTKKKKKKKELINENKPDPRIGLGVWFEHVLGLHNFVQAAYEPIMVRPMPEKTNVFQLPLCHVYYVRILLVNGKVCM